MLWPGWEGSVGPRGTKCRPNSQNFGSDFTPLYPAFGLPRDLLLRHGGWWSNVIVCLSVILERANGRRPNIVGMVRARGDLPSRSS